ncbi:ribosome maturation factor RimM [Devriesea agamarum]|uniref:ribosome maturation factor RimM n=1 Tax=Devriesea agamarum TaxID=472569 RepID=UPI000A02E770|nr:ribosome maturation factor RimM [Devriesea agamarum]
MNTLEVIVATIGKAHGLRGEVALILRTDQPEVRLAPGMTFPLPGGADIASAGSGSVHRRDLTELTIASTRVQAGRWYAKFEEVTDRTTAESLRGVELVIEVDPDEETEDDPEAWYPTQLKGLAVEDMAGRALGRVADLEHYPAQDVLIVATPSGERVMLPFVSQLVPEVDVEQGKVIADPPGGLFPHLEMGDSAAESGGAPESDALEPGRAAESVGPDESDAPELDGDAFTSHITNEGKAS